MDLPLLWFLIIAFFWMGYLVLEGFDFGVGMLMRPLSKGDTDRRLIINTIGPVWDGNEVWLIVAGAATFAAFPEWYATMFSGFYLPLLAILAALIIRGVAFEYRGKINDDAWRARWDWAITIGSWVPAVLWGVAFANFVRGVRLDADHQMVSGFFELLSPFALLGGATTALLFALHGAIFISLKTDGEMRERAGRTAAVLAVPTLVVAGAFAVWAQVAHSAHTWTWVPVGVAAVALVAVVFATRARREGWAFTLSALTIAAVVVFIFGSLYPNVLPAINDPANSLTISNASSTDYTLTIMTWVAACLTPLILAYQGWTYWVFRKRLTAGAIPAHIGLPRRDPAKDPASS
ncbi:cytochrome d ubiquinol oxidase subunit II [Occultella gossypii]|uniref:Cytochrome d ubiquinol oxidase subunit II n=1 Tax=Occultella gossypii TaxID=2800820 RepID=A0ABS7SGY6_9MICO|nr:cytochrome d ubiquinol oxidase subunit II [Occultella gossypii]MBZ2198536.1 cytochrome d ubiquinol oxidase subunit II [Occultella gossypii]